MGHIQGHGKISGDNEVTVMKADGSEEKVIAKHILIATGSEVTPFPGIEVSKVWPAKVYRSCLAMSKYCRVDQLKTNET